MEQGFQAVLATGAVKTATAQGGDGSAGLRDYFTVIRVRAVEDQNLFGAEPCQFGGQADGRNRHHAEGAGGNIDPCQCGLIPHHGKGRQIVVAARLEQGFLGQCARRHQPHNAAFHHGFGAALFRLGRILKLFTDGDAEPLADEGQ